MPRLFYFVVTSIAAFPCGPVLGQTAQAGETATFAEVRPRKLTINNKVWTRDFNKLLERRMIRVSAPFSRSLYFNDKGRERGIAVDLVRGWERYLNIKYAKQLGKRPVTIYILPATRDKLLPNVSQGLADVGIGNLTVTDERLKEVDFVPGDEGRRTISEVVVTGPKSPELKSLDDLSGKKMHVRKTSSYFESLQQLNERFKHDGKPEIQLILVPDALEDEDLMEMLDAGLVELEVVDDWKAHYVGAGITQAHDSVRSGAANRREDGMGDPQGKPKARCGDRRFLPQLGDEAGCGRLSNARLYEQGQGAEGPDRQCRVQAFRGEVGLV